MDGIEQIKGGGILSAIRTILTVLVLLSLGFLIAINVSNKPPAKDKVWDLATTMGDPEAKKHYVMYTDMMCPFCDVFSRAIKSHKEEFEKEYLEKQGILFEVRVTDFLGEYGQHKHPGSRWSAEGAHCAARQNRFWDYYYAGLDRLWEDYHSKGIGVGPRSPQITGMTEGYWLKIGADLGLGEEFNRCMTEDSTVEQIKKNSEKTANSIQGGLPFFKFGKFTTSGFDQSWGWDRAKQMLDAGL